MAENAKVGQILAVKVEKHLPWIRVFFSTFLKKKSLFFVRKKHQINKGNQCFSTIGAAQIQIEKVNIACVKMTKVVKHNNKMFQR